MNIRKITSTVTHAVIFSLIFAGTLGVVFAQGQGGTPIFQQIVNSLFLDEGNGVWTFNSGSITSDHIEDATIQGEDIADGTITETKLGGSIQTKDGKLKVDTGILGGEYNYRDFANADFAQSIQPETITNDTTYQACREINVKGNGSVKWGYAITDLGDICADNNGCSFRVATQHEVDRNAGVKTLEGSFFIGPETTRGGGINRHAFLRYGGTERGFWLGDNTLHDTPLWGWTWMRDIPRKGTNFDQDDGVPLPTNTSMAIISHPHTSASWTFCD